MQSRRLASAFAQIAPRSYTTVAQFFRLGSVNQEKSRAIAAHLQQATKALASIQPLLSGVLSEDEEGLLHFGPSETLPSELLHEFSAVKEILDYQDVSFDHLEDKHYGPSYCNGPAFAMPLTGRKDPVFRVALCWHSDGFVVVTYLHHAVADGLTCRYVIEALAAMTCGQQDDNLRHCQLQLGEITSPTADCHEHPTKLEEHCAYLFDKSAALPVAGKVLTAQTPTPARPKTQFLLRVWTPPHGRTTDDRSCSRFCKRAAQAWILTMATRHRTGLLKKQQPLGAANAITETSSNEHEHQSAQLLFAVGLSRPEGEWGSRAIYSKTSYPVSRLLRALDEPAEVRELEKHISDAIRFARQPSFATAHEQKFGDHLCHRQGDGGRKGRPADIRLCKPETDPFAFFFNTWGFMGQHSTSMPEKKGQPIRWQFPGFSAPRVPDRIRKVAGALGATSYCLVQPSTAAAAAARGEGEDDTDEIAITFEEDEAPEFAALVVKVSKQHGGHAGISSCWQILDTIRQIV